VVGTAGRLVPGWTRPDVGPLSAVSRTAIDAVRVAPVVSLPLGEAGVASDRQNIKNELARELHDQLAQNMTALLVQTQVFIRDQQGHQEVLDELAYVQTSVREMLNNLRQILCDLRGQRGLATGLVETLKEVLIPSFELRTGVTVRLWVSRGWPATLPPEAAINVYRIVQEALSNARRHGAATRVHVALRAASEGCIAVTIRDNGHGNPWLDEEKPLGMGLMGMRERAAVLGGMLTVRSRSLGGTRITATLLREAMAWPRKPVLSAS
jgi:signal transduction histidine kinase